MAASAASTEVPNTSCGGITSCFPTFLYICFHNLLWVPGFSSPVYQYPRKPGVILGHSSRSSFHIPKGRPDILRRLARNVSYQLIRLADGITGIFRGSLCQVHMAVAMGSNQMPVFRHLFYQLLISRDILPYQKRRLSLPSPWSPSTDRFV